MTATAPTLSIVNDQTEIEPPPAPLRDSGIVELPLSQILEPNPYQPRQVFGAIELNELAKDIKANGVDQNVTVRPLRDKNGKVRGYQMVAGERRQRAAVIAGLKTIPARIRDLTDLKTSEFALRENIHRNDLGADEEANALKNHISLAASVGEILSWEEAAELFNKGPKWGADRRKYLNLDSDLREMVQKKGAVLTSAFEIDKLPKTMPTYFDERRELIAQVMTGNKGKGIPYTTVKARVDDLIEKESERLKDLKAAQSPDAFTQKAILERERKAREARVACRVAAEALRTHANNYNAYYSDLAPGDCEAMNALVKANLRGVWPVFGLKDERDIHDSP